MNTFKSSRVSEAVCPRASMQVTGVWQLPEATVSSTKARNRKALLAIMTLLYAAIAGLVTVRLLSSYAATPAVHWMFFVKDTDVPRMADLPDVLMKLRTGIPPLLAAVEIIICNIFGDFDLITVYGYRIAMIAVFWLSFAVFSESLASTLVSFPCSVLFLLVAASEHRRMPEVYDVLTPLCFLLFLLLFKLARKEAPRSRVFVCLAAGFFLSMVELLRPYVIAMMPFLLLFVYLGLRRHGRRYVIAFLASVLLFSGSWHLKLLCFNDGQIIWSDFSGYNMVRCWRHLFPDLHVLHDRDPFRGSSPKRDYINSSTFYRNSAQLRRQIAGKILEHPLESAEFVMSMRVRQLLNGYSEKKMPPINPIIERLHRPLVWVLALAMCTYLLYVVALSIQMRSLSYWAEPESILSFFVVASIFFLAVGDYGEEFRFLISLLPLMAAFPVAKLGQLALDARRSR